MPVVHVCCLSSSLRPVIAEAVEALNQSQRKFRFKQAGGDGPEVALRDGVLKWDDLERVLGPERERLRGKFLMGVTDAPLENNFFSRAAAGQHIAYITTADWDLFSEIPVAAYVAHQLVENLADCLVKPRREDENWFLKELVHDPETVGCVFDMCVLKPQSHLKIRTGDICFLCRRAIEPWIGRANLEAIRRMLEPVRAMAIQAPPSQGRGRQGFGQEVEQTFAFPVAYCYRAVQAEFNGARKFLALTNLVEASLRYGVYLLLDDASYLGMFQGHS